MHQAASKLPGLPNAEEARTALEGLKVGTWDGVTAWAPLVDKHWVSATKKFTWTTPTTGTVQDFDRGTFLSFKASARSVPRSGPGRGRV